VTSERMVAGGERKNEEGIQVVLLRHGQSEWNSAKRFSGWMDIDLTEAGRIEAARAGKLLKLHNFEFDEAHASVLKRAVRTLWTALHSSNHHWIPVKHTWRLNERHYGALTGLSKTEAEQQLGSMMLQKYRRGYDTEPLPMKEDHPYWTGNDRRYRDLGALLPRGESLKQCKARILPYWYETVVPSVRAGRRVLIAAHNNVLRCLCKHLDRIPSDNLRALEIPTGDPIVYTLNRETLEPMGAPDELGFRGKFLDASDLHEEVSEHRTEETSSSSRNQLRPHRIPILILCVFPGTPTLTVSFSFKK
jgi:2,3-bisphosphoglycerate-dependent phosphoglycerate mutase